MSVMAYILSLFLGSLLGWPPSAFRAATELLMESFLGDLGGLLSLGLEVDLLLLPPLFLSLNFFLAIISSLFLSPLLTGDNSCAASLCLSTLGELLFLQMLHDTFLTLHGGIWVAPHLKHFCALGVVLVPVLFGLIPMSFSSLLLPAAVALTFSFPSAISMDF